MKLKQSVGTGVGVWLIVACASTAFGVVRNDQTVGNPGSFPCAVKVGLGGPSASFFCSGTVIGGGQYVITAKHCITGNPTTGSSWQVQNQAGTTITGSGTVRVHPTADLAIICLNGTFNNSYGLYCGTISNSTQVCFTGFGLSSDTDPTSPGNNTGGNGGPGTGNSELAYGTARTGYNVLDQAIGGNDVAFDFDLAGGVLDGTVLGNNEATTFGGDSGMGYLVNNGGTFQLAAVHGGILVSPGLNVDQSISYGTNIQAYKSWIMSSIPEPRGALLGMLVLAGIVFSGGRNRNR
jgi:hypothetical protein